MYAMSCMLERCLIAIVQAVRSVPHRQSAALPLVPDDRDIGLLDAQTKRGVHPLTTIRRREAGPATAPPPGAGGRGRRVFSVSCGHARVLMSYRRSYVSDVVMPYCRRGLMINSR